MTKSKYSGDYETRMLYEQKCSTDEGYNILTSMHACLWTYQQAVGATTSRIRITCIYETLSGEVSPVSGIIEQWKTEGWSVVDEFCDARQVFDTPVDFRDYLLEMTRAFLLGIPIGSRVEGDLSPKPRTPGSKPRRPFKSFTRKNVPQVSSDKVPPSDGLSTKGKVKDIAKDNSENPKVEPDKVDKDKDDDDWI